MSVESKGLRNYIILVFTIYFGTHLYKPFLRENILYCMVWVKQFLGPYETAKNAALPPLPWGRRRRGIGRVLQCRSRRCRSRRGMSHVLQHCLLRLRRVNWSSNVLGVYCGVGVALLQHRSVAVQSELHRNLSPFIPSYNF